jgi:RNA polymerase sigma factor (sigma-70 family)
MKKYNISNYVRYKEDLKKSMPDNKEFIDYTRNELIIKFLPLVESLARKFATSQQASGVLSINDLIQEGGIGLILAVDKITWETINESEDKEKTLKSFLSKRIKGQIRRAIDMKRGDIRIPEHKLNEIRNNPEDNKMVSMFFNSIFSSIDESPRDEENPLYNIEDKSPTYNIHLMNAYLMGLIKEHLTHEQGEVVRMSYGLDCDKHSAIQIAKKLNMKVNTAIVRVSQIKRDGIKNLIANTKPSQVIDYL